MPDNSDKNTKTTIRKYANRRLYNTETAEFVTLDDLRTMIREGQDFEVVDAKSKKDITSSVLAQIIAEQEHRGEGMLPDDIMKQIISFYDQGMTDQFADFFRQSMNAAYESRERFETLGKAGLENLETLQKTMGSMFGFPMAGPSPAQPEETKDQDEVAALREEMRRMQETLDKLAARKDSGSGQ